MRASQRTACVSNQQHAPPAPPINTELDPKAVPDWVFLSIKTAKSSSSLKKRALPAVVADESCVHKDEGYGSTSGDGSDSADSPHLGESASKKQRKPNHVRKRVRSKLQ